MDSLKDILSCRPNCCGSVGFRSKRLGLQFVLCLGSLQNTENEANLLLPLGIQKLKVFSFCPWAPLGAPPSDHRYSSGSHSPLAMCVHPTFFDLATPLVVTRYRHVRRPAHTITIINIINVCHTWIISVSASLYFRNTTGSVLLLSRLLNPPTLQQLLHVSQVH